MTLISQLQVTITGFRSIEAQMEEIPASKAYVAAPRLAVYVDGERISYCTSYTLLAPQNDLPTATLTLEGPMTTHELYGLLVRWGAKWPEPPPPHEQEQPNG